MGPDLGPEAHVTQKLPPGITMPAQGGIAEHAVLPRPWHLQRQVTHPRGFPPGSSPRPCAISPPWSRAGWLFCCAAWKRAAHRLRSATSPLLWAFSSSKRWEVLQKSIKPCNKTNLPSKAGQPPHASHLEAVSVQKEKKKSKKASLPLNTVL